MYAVIELGGKQYKVATGDEVIVDRLELDEGKSLSLAPLILGGEKKAVTAAELKGARVKAKVEEHLLGEKIRVFKYKPKSGYRRTKGHRSRLSRVSIQTISAGGKKAEAKAQAKVEKAEPEAAKAEPRAEKSETKTAKVETKTAKADTKAAIVEKKTGKAE